MVNLDVCSPDADLKCKKQAHHFHQLGLGVYYKGYVVEVDINTKRAEGLKRNA